MERDFCLLQNAKTGYRAELASYKIRTGGLFAEIKRPGAELYHTLPISVRMREEPSYHVTSSALRTNSAFMLFGVQKTELSKSSKKKKVE